MSNYNIKKSELNYLNSTTLTMNSSKSSVCKYCRLKLFFYRNRSMSSSSQHPYSPIQKKAKSSARKPVSKKSSSTHHKFVHVQCNVHGGSNIANLRNYTSEVPPVINSLNNFDSEFTQFGQFQIWLI
jgi:hypothetical protein